MTSSIGLRLTSSVLRALTEEEVNGKPRVFVPSIAEIKVGVAKMARTKRRLWDPDYNAQLARGGSDDSDLAWLRRGVSELLARGELPAPPGGAKLGTGEQLETSAEQPELLIDV